MSQGQEVCFEEASRADAKGLLDLMMAVTAETDFITKNDDEIWSVEDMAAFIDLSSMRENRLCLLAKLGQEVIGVLNVDAQWQDSSRHIGDVFIAVRKSYWDHGLGQTLLDEAIYWAEQTEIIRRLELSVQKRNERAIHIYEKFGFEIEGVQKRGARTKDGEFLDVYRMGKLID
ncbi:GNAT family N-acetyltransferase [uncultured Streptococcus sp.]|uniref:GNAT family N-acetyltransferase n=1 Tax=uncultured Streptococcus sp. TaxID=83427 RepID=UPI0027DE9C5B|nr:GNAT family N-acetyltransferase [uncultured Streptococcus sp.]